MALHGFTKTALAAALSFGISGVALAQTQATAPAPAATTAPAGDTMGTGKTSTMSAAPSATTGTEKASASGMAASKTVGTRKATSKLPAEEHFTTVSAATAHCPSDTIVWSTLGKTHAYHLANSKYYGKTKHGAYVCKTDADTAGFHAASN